MEWTDKDGKKWRARGSNVDRWFEDGGAWVRIGETADVASVALYDQLCRITAERDQLRQNVDAALGTVETMISNLRPDPRHPKDPKA